MEVKGTNATAFTLTSSALKLQRPAWIMPEPGEPVATPGLTGTDFADSGVTTNGLALPGDQGVDLEQGRSHYYALVVPTNNAGLLRVRLDAISGNPDVYLRRCSPDRVAQYQWHCRRDPGSPTHRRGHRIRELGAPQGRGNRRAS